MSFVTFPLFSFSEAGSCNCGTNCASPGKHPALNGWADLQESAGKGSQGYGILTGKGFFVVDCDGPEGIASFAALGDCPPTLRVNTPRGGQHVYFTHPENTKIRNSVKKLAQDVDVRGERGFVVGPGSATPRGEYVVATRHPLAPAPDWLLIDLADLEIKRASVITDGGQRNPWTVPVPTPPTPEILETAVQYLRKVPARATGDGGVHFFKVCRYLVRTLEIPLDVCAALIEEHYNPRATDREGKPWPWQPWEINHKLQCAFESDMGEVGLPLKPPPEFLALSAKVDYTETVPPPAAPRRYRYHFGDATTLEPKKAALSEVANILTFSEEWAGVFWYDTVRKEIRALNPPTPLDAERQAITDGDYTRIQLALENLNGITVWGTALPAIVANVAHARPRNPVAEYLADCMQRYPNSQELDAAGLRIFSKQDDVAGQLQNTCFRKFLIGAVRRVCNPGYKFDTCLILHGKQGGGKSVLIRDLFGADYTLGDLPADLSNKDSFAAIAKAWAVELAELDKPLRAGNNALKSFLSQQSDSYRPPYGRNTITSPRQCVFVGSSNDLGILRDSTGDRRFVVISADYIDLQYAREARDRIWAHAYRLAQDFAESDVLTAEERAAASDINSSFTEEDPWSEALLELVQGQEKVRYRDAIDKLGIETPRLTKMDTRRVTEILVKLGCKPFKYANLLWFRVPENLRKQEPPIFEKTRRMAAARVHGVGS